MFEPTSDQTSGQIVDDVSVQVWHDHNVELLRVWHLKKLKAFQLSTFSSTFSDWPVASSCCPRSWTRTRCWGTSRPLPCTTLNSKKIFSLGYYIKIYLTYLFNTLRQSEPEETRTWGTGRHRASWCWPCGRRSPSCARGASRSRRQTRRCAATSRQSPPWDDNCNFVRKHQRRRVKLAVVKKSCLYWSIPSEPLISYPN